MGNDFSKGVDSAVSIITGIITGDMTGGLAGASAPWLAEQIKIQAGDNETARLVAHAILGAVVAELQGNSGLAGGAGAVAGELANKAIIGILYGDKKISELSEDEKQTVSALSQLATGLATAATGGNFGDASAAISSSKNAVENNEENRVFDFFFTESKKIAEYNCYTDDVCNNLDDNTRELAKLEQSAEIQKEIIELYKEAGELLADIENTLLDFTPIIGDEVGKLLKEAKAALKVGDTKKASQLVKEAQNKLNALDVSSLNKASNTAGKGMSGQTDNVIKGFNQTETKIINEAQGILDSKAMTQIQQAHVTGQPVTVVINGRTIQYEPNLPASGMTMFGENGFLIGKAAFKSQAELQKTILHELHRLYTSSSAGGVSGALAAQEAKAAFDFAEKASNILGNK